MEGCVSLDQLGEHLREHVLLGEDLGTDDDVGGFAPPWRPRLDADGAQEVARDRSGCLVVVLDTRVHRAHLARVDTTIELVEN